jgi:hypothetical protein
MARNQDYPVASILTDTDKFSGMTSANSTQRYPASLIKSWISVLKSTALSMSGITGATYTCTHDSIVTGKSVTICGTLTITGSGSGSHLSLGTVETSSATAIGSVVSTGTAHQNSMIGCYIPSGGSSIALFKYGSNGEVIPITNVTSGMQFKFSITYIK